MTFDVKVPILGFEQIKRVKLEKVDDFFTKLISLDDSTTFMLINPFMLRDYDITIPTFFKNLLKLEEDTDMLVLNIMIVSKPIETSVINFLAPLVFNIDEKSVAQVLLDDTKHKNYGLLESISQYI
ncbi:MAG: flagellar assembly protein FliW [Epsilonproteobacteria bacterium]|nr:flagellar assembly protein FliW [Campylobacterota bacterium]